MTMYTETKVKTIYLAGGFRSNWQEIVKSKLNEIANFKILNPKDWNEEIKKQFTSEEIKQSIPAFEKAYTQKDIQAIEQSEVIIAYVEKDNLALGLALEVGYAVAKGKKVFLMIDQEHPNMRYWGMAKSLATRVFYIDSDSMLFDLPFAISRIKQELI